MKKVLIIVFVFIFVLVIIPLSVTLLVKLPDEVKPPITPPIVTPSSPSATGGSATPTPNNPTPSATIAPQSTQSGINSSPDRIIKVYLANDKKTIDVPLDEYIKGVVAAEMPLGFHIEALKAQAVVARTYLLAHENLYKTSTNPHVGGAIACTSPDHCQAYITEQEAKNRYGEKWDNDYKQKLALAINSTKNQYIIYNNQPIDAVFYSTSSGKTENAKDVWGEDISYLKSVNSYGDNLSPKYSSNLDISINDFKKKLKKAYPSVDFKKGFINKVYKSSAGGITTIEIGGVKIKGTEFRTLFGLLSTNANITYDKSKVHISVTGYGHGVGMSQYGANYLASEGKSYVDILKAYYSGIEIKN